MKTFEWRYVTRFGDTEPVLSMLEIFDGNRIRFWGILKIYDGFYKPLLINKFRNGYITTEELLTINDGKCAIEKKMLDEGIMEDGDKVIDHTE